MKIEDLQGLRLPLAAALLAEAERLYQGRAWSSVVRNCDAAVGQVLSALLSAAGVRPPKERDVEGALRRHAALLPSAVAAEIDFLVSASRELHRPVPREGNGKSAEGVHPECSAVDAGRALDTARRVLKLCSGSRLPAS